MLEYTILNVINTCKNNGGTITQKDYTRLREAIEVWFKNPPASPAFTPISLSLMSPYTENCAIKLVIADSTDMSDLEEYSFTMIE